MNSTPDDWRLRGQERYLQDAAFFRRRFQKLGPNSDHDHCAFCWEKFSEGDIPDTTVEGYTTADRDHWVCDACFTDFRERFRWTLVSNA